VIEDDFQRLLHPSLTFPWLLTPPRVISKLLANIILILK
jgi:hypothetical protein